VIRRKGATLRLWRFAALVLGVASIVVGLLLILIDGVDASTSWIHHAGLSSAPLLLVAGALTVNSIFDRPRGFSLAMRFITVTAFLAWGVSQLLPNSGVGTNLDDIAILLFVIDAGVFVVSHRLPDEESGKAPLSRGRVQQAMPPRAPVPSTSDPDEAVDRQAVADGGSSSASSV
jgi:hypothetical protein